MFPDAAQLDAMMRLRALDCLRGGLLTVMALNHVPSDLRVLTDQPLGYFSAAEGFVFLSGLLAGKVYAQRESEHGFAHAMYSAFGRAWQIYLAHLVCIAVVFVWSGLYVELTGIAANGAPSLFTERPHASLLAAALFLYRPGLLDILPLYCVCLLALPLVLLAVQRERAAWLLVGSLALWGAGNAWGGREPYVDGLINTGAISIAAWQLSFVVGTLLGVRWQQGRLRLTASSVRVLVALVACGVFAALRHGWLAPLPPGAAWLTEKINLAPLRLVNAGLACYLIALGVRAWPRAFASAPLELLGRHSLAVFTAHVVVAEIVLGLPELFETTALGRAAGNSVLLASMFATAAVAAARRRRRQALAVSGSARRRTSNPAIGATPGPSTDRCPPHPRAGATM